MRLAAQDMYRLRWSALLSLFLVCSGSYAVLYSLNLAKAKRDTLRLVQADRTGLQRKLSQLGFAGRGIRRYHELIGLGHIGKEKRLEWIETITGIIKNRGLIDLRYELAPQRPLDGTSGDGLVFMASQMKLQMQLLHEEDLINFLADLRANVPAFIRINSCNVERSGKALSAGKVTLQVDCSIDWITLSERK